MPGREVFAAASRHAAAHLPRLRALAVAGDRTAQPGRSKQTSLYPTEGSSCHREPTSLPRARSPDTDRSRRRSCLLAARIPLGLVGSIILASGSCHATCPMIVMRARAPLWIM